MTVDFHIRGIGMQFVTYGFHMRENKPAPVLRRNERHAGNRVVEPQYFKSQIDIELAFLDSGRNSLFHDTVNKIGIFN